jgi:hypothetical protein
MDLVKYPKGAVSLEELIILTPETSEGTLQEQLDTLTSNQNWCKIHITADTDLQQEISESPDIVQ